MAATLAEGKTIIVQGLGNVGYHAAKFLSEEDGVKVISEGDLDDNTPQTIGMKRYAAVAKKKCRSRKNMGR